MDAYQEKMNPPAPRDLARYKTLFYQRCREHDLSTPRILAVVSNDETAAPEGAALVRSAEDLRAFFSAQPLGREFVFKTIGGSYGKGLLVVTRREDGLFGSDGAPTSTERIVAHCLAGRADGRGFLVQERLHPHEALRPLMPHALGTVRVITAFRDDEVIVPWVFMKIPTGTNVVDNFEHGTTGNLLTYVDPDTGRVGKAQGPRRLGQPLLHEVSVHPVTGAVIQGFQIPLWEEVLRLSHRAAAAFSELRTAGWDIAVTDDGPSLLETNWHYDPETLQVSLERGLRPRMENLILEASPHPDPKDRRTSKVRTA